MAYSKPVSVVTTAYNEEKTVEELIKRIRRVLAGIKHEIIVVDDSSTDRTRIIAKRLADRVLTGNREGQMLCIWKGVRAAKYETVVTLDADLENLPEDIPRLLKRLDKYDYVCASRDRLPRISERISSALLSRAIGVSDTFTNFRCFNGSVKRYLLSKTPLKTNTYGLEMNILPKKGGFRVCNVPVRMIWRDQPRIGKTWRTDARLL